MLFCATEVKEKTAAENCKMPPQKEGTSSEETQVVQQRGKGTYMYIDTAGTVFS